MARSTPTLPQFNAGELSPRLIGRVDLSFYANGLSRGLNTIALPHGALVRRPGTRYHFAASATASAVRPFVFAPGDAYGIVFGNLVADIFDTSGAVVQSGLVTPWTAAQAPDVKWVQSADVLILVHPQVKPQQLQRQAGPTFVLSEYVLSDGPYYAPNTSITTMTVSATGVGAQTVTASSSVFVAQDVGRHFRIKAGASSTWVWGTITGYTSGTVVTVTFVTAVADIVAHTDWRMGLYGSVTGYPCAVAIHQQRLALASNPTDSFPRVDLSRSGDFPTFSPGTADDDAVALAVDGDQVPVLRNLRSLRQLVAVSLGGTYRVAADGVNQAISPTNASVSSISGGAGGNTVPATIAGQAIIYSDRFGKSQQEIAWDAINDGFRVREISIRNEHLLARSPLVDLAYADKPDGLILGVQDDGGMVITTYAPDQEVIAALPQEIGGDGIVESACSLPSATGDDAWLLVSRGAARSIEVLTRRLLDDDLDAAAVNLDASVTNRLAPQGTLTGTVLTADTVALVSSVAAFAPGDVGRQVIVWQDDVRSRLNLPSWVRRAGTISAYTDATHVTITLPTPREWDWPASVAADQWFLSQTVATGLSHLNGRTDLMALVDGVEVPGVTVSGGSYTHNEPWAICTVGIAYTSDVQPMPIDAGSHLGGAIGKVTKTPWTRCRVLRTQGLGCVGWDGTLNKMSPRDGGDPMDAAPPFFSGDLAIPNDAASDDMPIAPLLRANGAYPFCITALSPDVDVGEQ